MLFELLAQLEALRRWEEKHSFKTPQEEWPGSHAQEAKPGRNPLSAWSLEDIICLGDTRLAGA